MKDAHSGSNRCIKCGAKIPDVNEIERIIQRIVTIEKGNYEWGGATEVLGRTDVAAKEILRIFTESKTSGGFW